jgi:alpha-galactosidase/6-phospho-beta-glucosidase family protein
LKIAFLGAGALRLLGVVHEVLKKPEAMPSPELWFMDRDLPAAELVCALSKRMPSARSNRASFFVTDQLDAALDGADFVYCCIRVGGVSGLERDKRIATQHGYHGHDDFGPSAVMLTARTVPVMLGIARLMEKRCPRAWLLIFTNPITTLVDAVVRHTSVRCVGLCPGVYNFAYDMDHLYGVGVPCAGLIHRGGGLNHLSWVLGDATLNGRLVLDLIDETFDELAQRPGAERCGWQRMAPLIRLYHAMFLNNGHQHHFFRHDELAREMAQYYANTPDVAQRSSRQEQQRRDAAALLRKREIDDFWRQPSLANCAAGPVGDIGAQFMVAIHSDEGAELAVNVPNAGHVMGIADGSVVEAHARIASDRIAPLFLDPIPDSLKGLCAAIAAHQKSVVDASVSQDRDALFRALVAEPTIRSFDRAKPMFDELWRAHQDAR